MIAVILFVGGFFVIRHLSARSGYQAGAHNIGVGATRPGLHQGYKAAIHPKRPLLRNFAPNLGILARNRAQFTRQVFPHPAPPGAPADPTTGQPSPPPGYPYQTQNPPAPGYVQPQSTNPAGPGYYAPSYGPGSGPQAPPPPSHYGSPQGGGGDYGGSDEAGFLEAISSEVPDQTDPDPGWDVPGSPDPADNPDLGEPDIDGDL